MLKLAGSALLLCGSAFLGWAAARRLDERVKLIRQMLAAVQTMQRELSFALTSVPRLLELLERQTQGPLKNFFTRCMNSLIELQQHGLQELWQKALEDTELPAHPEERRIFGRLGEVLGRYDSAGQEAYFASAAEELERCLNTAEEERRRMGKVYRVLGVTAGGFLMVLLF